MEKQNCLQRFSEQSSTTSSLKNTSDKTSIFEMRIFMKYKPNTENA